MNMQDGQGFIKFYELLREGINNKYPYTIRSTLKSFYTLHLLVY
jgi:hypothetical protein